jgi:hypothetical protein
MSWIDRLETKKLTITTGDGETYSPLWMEAKKAINYNTEGFDFIGIEGTFVQRKEKSGNQYPLLLFFTGEDCIEQADRFEISARDKRPWTIQHPLYDTIICQPLSMEIDNTDYNVSRITCTVWETIKTEYPQAEVSIGGEIQESVEQLNELTAGITAETNPTPDTANVSKFRSAFLRIQSLYEQVATSSEDKLTLRDKFRIANGALDSFATNVLGVSRAANDLINFPFQLTSSTQFKLRQISQTLEALPTIFLSENPTVEEKSFMDSVVTPTMLTACNCAINPPANDYTTRQIVVNVILRLNMMYDFYLSLFDNIIYVQDPEVSRQVDLIVNTTLSNLIDVAFDSKQERSTILNRDNNMITIAHKYFGRGDENLEDFINLNNIELSEYLQIKKGRTIKWLV